MTMIDILIRNARARQAWQPRNTIFFLGLIFATTLVALSVTWLAGALPWHGVRLMFFFSSMAVVVIVMGIPAISERVTSALNRLASLLSRRGAFQSNAAEEAPKFALIRIAFGLFLTIRAFWLIYYMSSDDWSSYSVSIPAIASAIFALLVTVGLFTQPTFVLLILLQWHIGDALLGTSTLGNDIAALLSILLLFANGGAHLSLDAILRRRHSFAGRLIAASYYRYGLAPNATLQIAKLMVLFGYWCVCVYSLGIHLGEPAWMHGVAGPQLLTNNFMSRFGSELAVVFASSKIAVLIARISLWGMLPWYLLLLPCVVWGGLARAYAIIWGLLFFSLSMVVLRLGWLAEFEFLFFAALFWQRAFLGGPKTFQVAYDDRCNLCDRTVKFVKAVDVFNRVDLKPLSKNHEWLVTHGIDPDDAQKDLYGVKIGPNSRPAKGYDFYLMLSREVLILLPLYPILLIGQLFGGRSIYRFIADRRTKIFGVCQIPTAKTEHNYLPTDVTLETEVTRGDPLAIVFIHMVFLGAAYLTTIPTPFIFLSAPAPVQNVMTLLRPFGETAHVYGITPIDVFNRTDLRMAENWFTISQIGTDQRETLLPILDENGKRLQAHRSDRVYFGNTIVFRRGVIGHQQCEFDAYRGMVEYLTKSVSGKPGEYLYRQYYQPLPSDALLMEGVYALQPKGIICESRFSIP